MPTVVIFKAQNYLKLKKSGLSGNNLGGKIHTDYISVDSLHNVFPMVTESEQVNGVVDYQAIYLINEHPSVTAKGLVMFSAGTSSPDDDIRFGYDPIGVGDGDTFGRGQTIASKTTTPNNPAIAWKDGNSRTHENALILPDIPPNRCLMLWFERIVKFGAKSVEDNQILFIVDTNNIVGDSGIVQDPESSSGVITGSTEVEFDLGWLNNVIGLNKFLDDFFFLGNTTDAADASAWINSLATFKLKDICRFVFGLLDVMNLPKRNQLINGVDFGARAGYQTIIRRNINYVVLDTSGYQSIKVGSTHYKKIEKFLYDANRNPNIDFVIAMGNSSPYGIIPDNDMNADGTNKARLDAELRKTYHDLLSKYAHIYVSTGINNYQRTDVLGFNSTTPETPNRLLTTQPPNYVIPFNQKTFKDGCMFINISSGIRKPVHNFPTANLKDYVIKKYVPQGVVYMKFYTTQRSKDEADNIVPPVLEARVFDYYADPPAGGTTSNAPANAKVEHLIDRFTITYDPPPETP